MGNGKKVMVGGKFNIIHPGHIWFLKKARSYGDRLVVVVASDRTILKNHQPLVFSAKERKSVIESLSFVDKAVIGDPKDFFRVVEREKPDIIVLGYDQHRDLAWLRERIGRGGKPEVVMVRTRLGDYSTSKIIGKIKKANKG
ncbi:MAG: adenylyltransferase/cytidyltransferase family protein [Candidatus Aenigmarchaeota archaeon]|nr:adenylyltransferase/cytidyltransferase family protein [Candidatus Aenigmarchaeota archaeon]